MESLLIESLQLKSPKPLKVKINNNRSTMVSVRWKSDYTQVSLHRMFLSAPENIMQALSCYISRQTPSLSPCVQEYIEDNLKKTDYFPTIPKAAYEVKGHIYDLSELLNQVNEEYFQGRLDLSITWFGKQTTRQRRRVTLGLYQDALKLIKIHRLMDTPLFPRYVIEYVVYHEMLHHVCPSVYDRKRNVYQHHNVEFRNREREFKHYARAVQWLNMHVEYLFSGADI